MKELFKKLRQLREENHVLYMTTCAFCPVLFIPVTILIAYATGSIEAYKYSVIGLPILYCSTIFI